MTTKKTPNLAIGTIETTETIAQNLQIANPPVESVEDHAIDKGPVLQNPHDVDLGAEIERADATALGTADVAHPVMGEVLDVSEMTTKLTTTTTTTTNKSRNIAL